MSPVHSPGRRVWSQGIGPTLALPVLFGGVSIGLWAWFHYRPMDRWRERQATLAETGGSAGTVESGPHPGVDASADVSSNASAPDEAAGSDHDEAAGPAHDEADI